MSTQQEMRSRAIFEVDRRRMCGCGGGGGAEDVCVFTQTLASIGWLANISGFILGPIERAHKKNTGRST